MHLVSRSHAIGLQEGHVPWLLTVKVEDVGSHHVVQVLKLTMSLRSGGLAIIGAYGHSTKWKSRAQWIQSNLRFKSCRGDGAAYIFKREKGKWVEQAELLPEVSWRFTNCARQQRMGMRTMALAGAFR